MFALQNLNLILNNIPQMSVLAKYSIFPSSFLPVKKLAELDAVCYELAQTVQFVKKLKNEKFFDHFTNMKHELDIKAFELLCFEDLAVKLIKGKKRSSSNVGLPKECTDAMGIVTCSSNSNIKIANSEKCLSTEHNYSYAPINNIDLFQESHLSDSLIVINEKKKPVSVISHLISLKNISNQIMYKNGFLHKTHGGGLWLNAKSINFQGQKRGFKTKQQIQMELDRSVLGVFLNSRKVHEKDSSSSGSSENLQTSTQGNPSKKSMGERMKDNLEKSVLIGVKFLVIFFCSAIAIVLLPDFLKFLFGEKFALSHVSEAVSVTFDDAKGMDEAKAELKCVVEFLRDPSKFIYLGGKLPTGVLIQGPPGTGKTLLARAVAGEANVQFFHISGSEFDELLVGEGARRVRTIFNAARKRAPAVIFIDEIDSVGSKRVNSSLHPFANQTITQLLTEMDGFVRNDKIVVIGATNRGADLDEALLRPGRFDLKIQLFKPDIKGRREILKFHLNKIVSKDIDVEYIAKRTVGFAGADLENLVNQAALSAATDGCDFVSTEYMDRALEKILLGPEMKSMVQTEEMKKITAYHESGHATVAHFTRGAQPLVKATIVPHGQSLGHTAVLNEDRLNYSKAELLAIIDVNMGGRVAEELVFGADNVTMGCENDLDTATKLAKSMVCYWGMSDKIGLRTLRKQNTRGFQTTDWGQTAGDEIDLEIKRIIQESYERVKNLLKKHAKEHKLLAEKLLENETLDADEIKKILSQGRDEDGSGGDGI